MSETVDVVEQTIANARQRGQRISAWQRSCLQAWVERKVIALGSKYTYLDLQVMPTLCNCVKCGEPSIIFPPEQPWPNGYCICPKCSFQNVRERTA